MRSRQFFILSLLLDIKANPTFPESRISMTSIFRFGDGKSNMSKAVTESDLRAVLKTAMPGQVRAGFIGYIGIVPCKNIENRPLESDPLGWRQQFPMAISRLAAPSRPGKCLILVQHSAKSRQPFGYFPQKKKAIARKAINNWKACLSGRSACQT
jgi:hypothetical protein